MRLLRLEAHRRTSFLIADKSLKRPFIGWAARTIGAIGVGRALDSTKTVPGKVYLPDPTNDPTLIRGVGTNFETKDFQVGGLLVLPSINHESANTEIAEVLNPEELRLKKPFTGSVALKQLTGRTESQENGHKENGALEGDVESQINKSRDNDGTSFKVAPKVDTAKVYDKVFEAMSRGGCIGIFPEGGSHDRTELLPLKGKCSRLILSAHETVTDGLYSWRGHHGIRDHGCEPGLWPKNRASRYELLQCPQVPFKSSRRVWDTTGHT